MNTKVTFERWDTGIYCGYIEEKVKDQTSLTGKETTKIVMYVSSQKQNELDVDLHRVLTKPSPAQIDEIVILNRIVPKGNFRLFQQVQHFEKVTGLANLDTRYVTSLKEAFWGCRHVKSLDGVEKWDTSNVTSMNNMFRGCTSLENIDGLATWDVSRVRDISGMFERCHNINDFMPIACWNTSNVTHASGTFAHCSFTDVSFLTNWNTNHLMDITDMFISNPNLSDISGLVNWNTGELDRIGNMLHETAVEDLSPIFGWDVTRGIDFGEDGIMDRYKALDRRSWACAYEKTEKIIGRYPETLEELLIAVELNKKFRGLESQQAAAKAYFSGVPLCDICA